MERRTAARSLATSFEDDNDQEQEDTSRAKNKQPLAGPPTTKNKRCPPAASETGSDF